MASLKVHRSSEDNTIIGSVPENRVPQFVKDLQENGTLWGAYLKDDSSMVLVKDKFDEVHETTLFMSTDGYLFE